MPEFREIQFQQVNVDDPGSASLVSRFQASSIPRLIFFDASDKVIHDQTGAFSTAKDFASQISHTQ